MMFTFYIFLVGVAFISVQCTTDIPSCQSLGDNQNCPQLWYNSPDDCTNTPVETDIYFRHNNTKVKCRKCSICLSSTATECPLIPMPFIKLPDSCDINTVVWYFYSVVVNGNQCYVGENYRCI